MISKVGKGRHCIYGVLFDIYLPLIGNQHIAQLSCTRELALVFITIE